MVNGKNAPKLPKQQLTILALCRFAEPVAMTSVYPYIVSDQAVNLAESSANPRSLRWSSHSMYPPTRSLNGLDYCLPSSRSPNA